MKVIKLSVYCKVRLLSKMFSDVKNNMQLKLGSHFEGSVLFELERRAFITKKCVFKVVCEQSK